MKVKGSHNLNNQFEKKLPVEPSNSNIEKKGFETANDNLNLINIRYTVLKGLRPFQSQNNTASENEIARQLPCDDPCVNFCDQHC